MSVRTLAADVKVQFALLGGLGSGRFREVSEQERQQREAAMEKVIKIYEEKLPVACGEGEDLGSWVQEKAIAAMFILGTYKFARFMLCSPRENDSAVGLLNERRDFMEEGEALFLRVISLSEGNLKERAEQYLRGGPRMMFEQIN